MFTSSRTLNNVKKRDSNIELFRIITMLLIVAHHYVVNSGLTTVIENEPLTFKSIFLLIFGAWGKIGINCFVLITGYFMCKSNITVKKFLKLALEVVFYNLVIYLIFVFTGITDFSLGVFIQTFLPVKSISDNFAGCFIAFYLSIPFINVLIRNINKKQHLLLLSLLLFIYVVLQISPFSKVVFNYFSWFIVLYLVSSFIHMYPCDLFNSRFFWMIAVIICVLLSSASVILCAYKNLSPYALVTDTNTPLALLTGLSAFMFFKNIKLKYHVAVNWIASSTFGVLLIHANSDVMRQWLWEDTLHNAAAYQSNMIFVHAIVSVVVVFFVCILLDKLRIYLFEKPFFKLWDKFANKYSEKFKNKFLY